MSMVFKNSKKPVMVAIYNSMHDLWLRGKGGTWESEIYPQMVSLCKKKFCRLKNIWTDHWTV